MYYITAQMPQTKHLLNKLGEMHIPVFGLEQKDARYNFYFEEKHISEIENRISITLITDEDMIMHPASEFIEGPYEADW